jgi:DNA-binding MarR family transcriptional regulator
MHSRNDIYPLLRRALLLSIQSLGIQQSATDILFTLYLEKHTNQSALPNKEIAEKTGLSLSSVSALCSRLESEGILIKQSDDSSTGRGRRKILYELNMGINEILTLGLRKYVQEAARICRDAKSQNIQNNQENKKLRNLHSVLENEMCSFIYENCQFVADTDSIWLLNTSRNDIE